MEWDAEDAGMSGRNDHALACLLALNALRVSEAYGADLTDLALANGHRVVRIVGKGTSPRSFPSRHGLLAPSTPRSVRAPAGHRWLARTAAVWIDTLPGGSCADCRTRRDRQAHLAQLVATRRDHRRASHDAGCSLRDVQDFARHADPRQTRRYDRARGALDRNPTCIVATYLAGATGAR